MLKFKGNCKLAFKAMLLLILFSCHAEAQVPTQNQPKTGKELAEIAALVTQQRDLADGAEAVAYGRLVAAYSALFRQREIDDDNKKELAKIQKELYAAEINYRNLVAFWTRAHAIGIETGKLNPAFISSSYERAIQELLLEVGRQPVLLHRDIAVAKDDEEEEARKGAARGRTRAAYLKATVAAEQWASFEPIVESDNIHVSIKGMAVLPAGRFSTLLVHMGWLAQRVATTDPEDFTVPVGQDDDLLRFLKKTDLDAALEEYRRLAATGLLINPINHKPVEGKQRTELAKILESNLQEYVLIQGSQQSDYNKTLWGEDERVRLAKQIEKEIKDSPEYRIVGFLDAGIEPSFKEFFLAAALAVSQTQLQLRERFSKEYLGEGFWNTGLGQLVRANNVVGTGDAGYDEVIKRVDKAVADGDVVIKALKAAAFTKDPNVLKKSNPSHYKLLKAMGYIVEYTGKDKKPTASYRIPGTRRTLGNRLRSSEADAKIPGASVLDVITPKSVAITMASMVIPELGAAWLTSGAAVLTTTSGGLLAIRAVAEMGVGFYLDTALEKCEKGNKGKKLPDGAMSSSTAFLENCYAGKVNYEKLILESVVLGSLIQIAGGKTSELLEWINWKRQRAALPDRFYRTVESRLRQNPRDSEALWNYVGETVGLAQETAITESFQMVSEGRDFDMNAMFSTLINNALSRQMSKHKENLQNVLARPETPRLVRDIVNSDPVIRREVRENHAKRLTAEKQVRERYEALTRDTQQPGRKVFEGLLKGDFTWTELKNLFANDPEAMSVTMQEVADQREHFFKKIVAEARKRSIDDVEQYFAIRIEAAVREAGSREAAFDQITALAKRRQAELDLINAEIKTPGSSNPTSDIDRSSSSAFLRKNLIHTYEAHADWIVNGDLPTSAKAFDVNEYINVFPFITENAGLVPEIKREYTADGMPHSDYMEAMSLSGAIQHMFPEQGASYIKAQRLLLTEAIADGRATQDQLAEFEKMVKLANDSLQTSRTRLRGYAEDIARQEGKDASDPEMQLKAKEYMYELRMKEIRELQWKLSELERSLGDQKHKDAIKLRAQIERKMSLAMRDGIETYSYTVGLDIIVNRVQSAKKPKLDKNGNPKIGKDGKPEMEGLSVADRLADPGFTLQGELSMYTVQDMRAVLNDQVMFIAEHVNGFNSGHESTYLAGRGIGKYTERAFLALKLQGLDIAEARKRGPKDPTRRLLELSQEMARLKNDPLKMNELLAKSARRDPKTPESGLAEVFYLLEQVIPGMEGLTGVVPPKREPGVEIVPAEALNPYARPGRNSATQKEIERLFLIAKGAGQQVAEDYLGQEIAFTQLEIKALERELKEMQEIGAEYRLIDWEKIRKLKTQTAGLRLQKKSLLWSTDRSKVKSGIDRHLKAVEQQLDKARITRIEGDIHKILYQDVHSWGYRRLWHRLEWLRFRLEWLQSHLDETHEKAVTEAVLDRLDLSGAWTCGRQNQQSYSLELNQSGENLTGILKGDENSGLSRPVSLSATFIHGELSGFWEDDSKPIEALDLPIESGPTRMMFQAMSDPDGKRFQFVYAPTHPRTGFRLQDVICTRGSVAPVAPVEFMQTSQLPVPADWKLKAGEGFVRAMLLVRGQAQKPVGFVLLKGRQRVKISGGTRVRVAAGNYTIVVRLGGKQARKKITVNAGVINQLELNAGYLTVNSLTASGASLDTGYRIYDPNDKAKQGVLHEGRTGQSVPLTPGNYTVIIGDLASFPLVMNVSITAAGSHILDGRWKQIQVPETFRIDDSEYIQLRAQIEGADTSNWHTVGPPQTKISAKGATVFLPEGTYSAKSRDGKVSKNLKAQ